MITTLVPEDFHKIYVNATRENGAIAIDGLAGRQLARSKTLLDLFGVSDFRRANIALAAYETGRPGHEHLANTLLMFNNLSPSERVKYIDSFKRHSAAAVGGLWSITAQSRYSWGELPPVAFTPGTD